jgi:GrpB-like predicted nucleotidyltransferase (UPF0157 family)
VSAIEIVDYDERWPAEFQHLRERLLAALAPLAAQVEHVGTTAVPGLAAKPKLDVDVVVSAKDVEAAIQRLGAIGFEHQGDLGVPGREALKGPDDGNAYHRLRLRGEQRAASRPPGLSRPSANASGDSVGVRGAQARPRGAFRDRSRRLHAGEIRVYPTCARIVSPGRKAESSARHC